MPIYEYECLKCKAHTEVFQKASDKPPVKCKKCGGRLERVISAAAIQFKGTGWYVTDYAGKKNDKGKKAAEKSESSTTATEKSDTKETSPSKKTSDSSANKSNAD